MGTKALATTAEQSSIGVLDRSRLPGSGGAVPVCNTEGRDTAPLPKGDDASPAAPVTFDPLTFDEVYERHFNFVWRSLRLLGVPPEAVEDVTQDAFSVVSRQLGLFEGRSSMRTWLFAILQRVAANHRRKARRKLWMLEPLSDALVGQEPTPHARAEAAEAIDLVQRFCDTLDSERRAVFVLSLLEELPAPEVAHVLGIALNTVYSRVRSLRDGLRRALEGREVEHD